MWYWSYDTVETARRQHQSANNVSTINPPSYVHRLSTTKPRSIAGARHARVRAMAKNTTCDCWSVRSLPRQHALSPRYDAAGHPFKYIPDLLAYTTYGGLIRA